jgi:serine/threonine protein kinase
MAADPPTSTPTPELASGRRLDEVLRERRLSVTEILSVMKGICRALAQAHESGVLHLRLSPHAVVVSPDLSTVRLTDFGSARQESLVLTGTLSTGSVSLGAFHYLAPEQTDSSGPAPDHRADLYATGAIFQEMLTGKPPTGKFSLPSQVNGELPPETDVIVLKCLARNPGGRYATALDLLADLGRLEEALRMRLLSELRGIQKAAPRRGLLVAGVVLLLIALVVAGYFLAR